MSTKRIQFNNVVQNQLPGYVRSDYPLVAEFLKSYYQGQEYQGGPIDLVQNIDQYTKVSEQVGLTEYVGLGASIGVVNDTIEVDMKKNPTGTLGFPDSYGLLKINDEIITYTGITTFAFTGCVRGFVGVSSYQSDINPEELVFESTSAQEHDKGDSIQNLSSLFLKEFLVKTKHQLTPGFESRKLSSDLDQNIFIKQSKDFYLSKGTDRGFEILFKSLYNENVKIIRPSEFLFTPSNANYKITRDFVVEPISGDPMNLELSTLYQDAYKGENIEKAYAPITHVEPINVSAGTTFYKLSIDAGFNRDSRVEGSTYGTFVTPPRTRVIGEVGAGITVVDVDSTVGFGSTGELYFKYIDNTVGVSSYTSKSLTQFFGLTGIGKTILSGETIGINTFAYGKSVVDFDETVEVRITSVIDTLDYENTNCLFEKGDTVKIKTLGIGDTGFKLKEWFYNIAPVYQVEKIDIKDISDFTYEITLTTDHDFKVGDKSVAILVGSDGRNLPVSDITQLTSSKSFVIKGQGEINRSLNYTIERQILKANAINFPEASAYSTNIQNVYKEKNTEKLLIASSSIPTYGSQSLGVNDGKIIFSGSFSGDEYKVITNATTTPSGVPIFDHGFYTGDAIYYTPQIINDAYVDPTSGTSIDNFVIKSSLMDEGLYFVKRVNETTLKFAKSGSDLYNGKFINIDNDGSRTGIVTDNKISPFKFNNKTLISQKILREVCPPDNTGTLYETTPGHTGILVNGVEILNYKSFDQVHYGKLNGIDVLAGGRDYDVINPPFLHIKDSVGTGATGYVAVEGELRDIRIIDTGFDYQETPTVKITGGNGSGARVSVNMESIEHSASFESDSPRIGLETDSSLPSTIGFTTYHKLKNAEEVIYVTNNQEVVGGLTTSSTYFAALVGTGGTTIRLHKDEAGALAGINTIALTSKGVGKHFIKAVNKKSIVESINIISGGSGYQNKKRTTGSSGINTALNSIKIENHDYKSGEIVRYSCDGTPIAGLTTATDFYVTKVDDDNFKLSSVGVGTTSSDFYYKTEQYRPLTSIGVGTHTFNYQDISVSITGDVGINSVGSDTFELKVQPIIRGEITSIHLSNNGVGYGASEIINFVREPEVTLLSGSDAQLTPIVGSNGNIIDVIVENKGTNYNSPPNLQISGDGVGAVITPILKVVDLNGNASSVGIGTTINYVLDTVNVIHEGAGYSKDNTSIDVINSGSDCKTRSNIQKWTVNLFEKYYQTQQITDDDGIIKDGNIELQYNHLYAPRKLRQTVYSTNQEGQSLYGEPDLRKINGQELPSDNHSPIIGWAYDGNPIYGPYGYIKKAGGTVTQMKSGYVEEASIKENRPPLNIFPAGFFTDDFTYKAVSDETVLDENNGRFCVTPQFPSGTYAYFTTIDDSGAEQGGQFNTFKLPVFPYLIGKNYYSTPNDFNLLTSSNQDDYNLENTKWCRNTSPYNLIYDNKAYYPYMPLPNNLSQTIDVLGTQPGVLESIGIETGGKNYQIGDKVIFNNTGTRGRDAVAKVSKLLGKSVSSVSAATSSITNVEIYPSDQKGIYSIVSTEPHQWISRDIITVTGLSTTSSEIGGVYNAGITSTKLTVTGVGTTAVAIGTDGATGIVTHIDVRGDLSKLQSNDILGIGTETLKLLNVEPLLSRIRVLRAANGVTGVSHTVTSEILEEPRRLTINSGFTSEYEYRVNQQIYFNPVDSVGLGTRSGVGIGTTIVFSNPGIGITQKFIQTKAIYLPDHGLKTGDKLTYSPNQGEGLNIREDGAAANTGISTLIDGQTVFAAAISEDLLGISTCKVGLGTTGTFVGIASTQRDSTTVFFSGVGTGVYHSFKTNYDVITGEIRKVTATVSTGETHGLLNYENVYMNVVSGLTTTVSVKYNDYNRRMVIDPKSFTAAGVNTTTNSFTINDHGYETGDKIIHTASTPVGGLDDNGIYYIVKVDTNTFKLTNTDYAANEPKPDVIGITSTSTGTINPINPPIKVYKNSTVEFDLSDASLGYFAQSTNYPAFVLNFYADKNLTKQWDTSSLSTTFNVKRTGTAGVSTNAKVSLFVTNDIPEILYYHLDPVFESTLPLIKKEIEVDTGVLSGNEIQLSDSLYSGKQVVTIGATNQFSYTLKNAPERTSYATTSFVSYETDSPTAYGAIADFEINNRGTNYYNLPGISTINTEVGSGAIIEAKSTSIGKIKKLKVKDIGYDFPSDTTIKPDAALPQIIKIDSLMSIESIGITSFGRGYISAPDLILIDGKTDKPVLDADLKYTLGNPKIEILKNTKGISNTPPTIITDKNSNGIGIATVGFNTENYDVTVQLSVGFSTADTFPIAVGDEVFIEGVSVGVGTTARGYNSKDYDYKLFSITAVDQNYGGIGTVTYNLSNYFTGLAPGLSAGSFDFINSSGRIVPKKFMPTFDIKLKPNDFSKNEIVTGSISSTRGNVENWNPNTGILRVTNTDGFVSNDIIKGLTSGTQGLASSIKTFDSYIKLNATSRVEKGWETDSGFFNTHIQRIQDSDYYQNLSYSISSKVDMETWDDPVSTLNHTLGFKKFSNYQLESTASARVGLSTELSDVSVVNDLYGIGNLNCVYDFDLVTENSFDINVDDSVSDEITFSSRILKDYSESVGNRVVSIDDFSGTFNSNPRATRFSTVSRFTLSERRALKYITYVRDKRFGAQRQLMIVDIIHDNVRGYINQYGRVESVYDQGDFDFAISGSEGQLNFYPVKYSVNDYFVASLSYNLDDNLLSTGSTVIGPSLVDSESIAIGTGIGTTTIVGIASTYRSAKVIININPDISGNEHEYNQLNIIHNDDEVDIMEYGRLTTVTTPESIGGLGTYRGYIDGSTLKVDFIANSSVGIGTTGVINTIVVGMADSTSTGIGTVDLKHARIESKTTSIDSSSSPGITTIGEYPSDYESAYGTIQVTDATNQVYSMFEFAVVTDYVDGSTTETYDVEFGNVSSGVSPSGLGTFGSKVSSAGTVSLLFTPVASINAQVNVYMNAIRIQDDTKDNIDLNNGVIESGFGEYEGTESAVLRAFGLSHKTDPIFRKPFDGSSSGIVDTTNNTINLPNHFFVTGEELVYTNPGTGYTMSLGIASTDGFAGIGTTTLLPSTVYAVKIDDETIKLAESVSKALQTVPEVVDITSVGIGTSHCFNAVNQNKKALISIDNILQSPIVSTAVTTHTADQVFTTDDNIEFAGITSFYGGDLIKIGNEILRIDAMGQGGNDNLIKVKRPWAGTALAGYGTGTLITKVDGNYNIVDNTINFVEAPYGNVPLSTSTNRPDSRDWVGIATGSSFEGRTFMRSGVPDTANEPYWRNYIFDSISGEFNGQRSEFTLKSGSSNISGIVTDTAIVLINDVFQTSGTTNEYTITEDATVGVTTISFTGTGSSTSDVNVGNLPKGGIIVSVGSSEGFGYQPLVAAGGTVTVAAGGTIKSISIGNTGSGYRAGIQTVNVGIQTLSRVGTNVIGIGTAQITTGHITGIAVTNADHIFYSPRKVANVGYSSVTGISTITTQTNHGLSVGDEVTLSGIAFTCDYSPRIGIHTAVYDNISGIMTVTTAVGHGLSTSGQKSVVIFTGLAFTCGLDNGASTHYYPRGQDSAYHTAVEITKDGSKKTITNAVYNPNTGIMTVTSPSHGISNGDKVKFAPNSLTFTCDKDNHATSHTYPRKSDTIANQWITVSNVSTNTFRVNVLPVAPSTNTGVHTFVSALANGLTHNDGDIAIDVGYAANGDQFVHQFVSATSGAIVAGGSYAHRYVGSDPAAVISGGDYNHTFVSSGIGSVSVTGIGTTTATDATYNASTGNLVLTIPSHGLSDSDTIGIATGGIVFTCSMDSHTSNHPYPRSTDPIAGITTAITDYTTNTITVYVGTSATVTHNVSDASYNPDTGALVLSIASHGLSADTSVRLKQDSLRFRCEFDDYASIHTYPRYTDPGFSTAINIDSKTDNTITLNVGTSKTALYSISTASYSASAGILTVSIGAGHSLRTGQSIGIKTESLSFRCSRDNYATVHRYPRKPDPYYTGTQVTAVGVGTTTFECNIGVSTVPTFYVGLGSVQSAIIAPRLNNNSASKFDVAANGSEVLRVIDSKTFETQTGISTRNHEYARGGVVNGYNKVVFDDPLSYSGIGLTYISSSTGIGTGATIDIVVGQGSSVISFTIQNTGSGYGNLEKLTVPIGGTTGIPTDPSKTFTEMLIDIEEVFNDEFSGWSVGQLEVLDNVERYIDGSRVDFPLTVNNESTSIVAKKGSKIDVQDLLLVFVNNIPQVPGKGYKFPGGSVITFTEAPKVGDTIEIIFYKGTGGQDVVERKVIETVKEGDDLTIGRLQTQDTWLQETARVPISVDSTDVVSTPPYYGPGNTPDTGLERPINWCRQTEDKIINEKGVGKSREIYEPVINPYSPIIKSVGIGSTVIYVESARPYFDPQDEVNQLPALLVPSDFTFQKKVKIISQEDKIGAAGTAIVSGLGTISSVAISTGGVGYSTATVSFATTSISGVEVGIGSTSTTAFGSPIIGAAGTITGIALTSVGSGYTSSNPPMVLISPPVWSEEENKVDYYQGDSGIIVGFGTTTIGAGSTNYQLIFDLHIPLTSDLRDSNITGTAVTISGISTGDFFIVNNSTVGSATTSINSVDTGGAVIGVGTQFLNNVYEVNNYEIVQAATGVGTTGVGIGTTHLNRVFVKVTNFNTWSGQWPTFSGAGIQTGNYFGAYSWGKINLTSRSESNTYNAYTLGGTGGISTSPVVKRSASLKYKDYRTP